MLREARTFRELPLRGTGYVSINPADGRPKVVCMIETADPSAQIAAAAAGLFDENGRLVSQWTADAKTLAAPPILGALVAPRPGTYRLRVAASDASRRGGSADEEVRAELAQAGPLKVSSLVLGLSRGTFVPRMLFVAEPVALAYVDVYGTADPAGITVGAEIARTVDGPAPGSAIPGALRAVTGDARLIATVALPIGGLAAGDYVVRVLVTPAGQPPARVWRTLRKR